MKIKIGRDHIEEDVERTARAQARLPKGGRHFVDLNQKWSAAEAPARALRLDRFELGWIEEPLACQDVAGHAALRRAIGTPIARGESRHATTQVLDHLRAHAIDIFQADVAFVGGVTEWLKIAHLAEACGRPVAPHDMMELSLPLLCGAPNGFMLKNVVCGGLAELGLAEAPFVIRDGHASPSERPGHGRVPRRGAIEAAALTLARADFSGGGK